MTRSITAQLADARASADDVVKRHGVKNASLKLYDVLAQCLSVVERCNESVVDYEELVLLFKQMPPDDGNKRRYIEQDSDAYQLVCRYVFAGSSLSNCTRYAQALREAGKLRISSFELKPWLRRNGGVVALYFRRPLDARSSTTKAFHLRASIAYPRDKDFSVTLRWNKEWGVFNVVKEPEL